MRLVERNSVCLSVCAVLNTLSSGGGSYHKKEKKSKERESGTGCDKKCLLQKAEVKEDGCRLRQFPEQSCSWNNRFGTPLVSLFSVSQSVLIPGRIERYTYDHFITSPPSGLILIDFSFQLPFTTLLLLFLLNYYSS